MYLGLLYTLEDFAIYGYLTNTKVKFIIVLTIGDTPIRESEIRTTFRRIHNEYMNLVMNPFFNSDSSSMIKSKKFIKAIDSIVAI
ncbi:Sedlin [Paraphysoderma sedebokerense]|nr:Sedlin [Paraphysoderma sedebokerense]